MNGPCPLCDDPAGFHDDQIHALIRANIPKHLLKAKGWQRDEQGEAAGNPPVGGAGSAQAASGADSTSDSDGAQAGTP